MPKTAAVMLSLLVILPGAAQPPSITSYPIPAHVLSPQLGGFSPESSLKPIVTGVEAGVVIRQQSATTTLDIGLYNPSSRRAEAEVWIPIPQGAVIRSFTFQGSAPEPAAKILTKIDAATLYQQIVTKVKDPALLEFSGYAMARSRVFPLESGQRQQVRLTYEHLLTVNGNRIDYDLPRSESLSSRIPWRVSVKMTALQPVSTAYSPSHKIEMKRESATTLSVRTAKEAENEAGPFRVSFLLGGEGVASTLFAAPDERENGGYFLMLAGPPAELTNARKAALIRREVTLVLDRSGSMEGEKIVQLKAAAKQTLSALGANEYFNLVVYHHDVQLFSPTPVLRTAANLRKALAFVDAITADGGTNIEAALRSAMQMPTVEGTLPVVLFVTDGVPSRGITSEAELRKIAVTQNVHRRRLFAFGVGADLNAPLLDKISTENRGVPTYVLPGETAEVKMTQTFRKLAGPVLSDVKLDVLGTNGQVELGRVVDVLPAQLPDLFEGDQFVILGRYNEDRPMTVRISGNFSGKPTSFTQKFEMDRKTTQNSFVPRLWASRKIGAMGDELRQLGADRALVATSSENPAVKELVGSILRLSTQFGIMSEYTAFLAMEGTDLTKRDANLARAMTAFQNLPMMVRTGPEAVRQALNTQAQMSQVTLNRGNQFIAVNQTQTDILSIQLANDLTFFKKDGKWVDTRLLVDGKAVRAARTVKMGTPEFVKLMEELTSQGRGGFATLRGEAIVLFHGEPVLVELQ